MTKTAKTLWGITLMVIGVLWILHSLGLTSFNLFFPGWWTLLLIVPCLLGLLRREHLTGNAIGVFIGLVLFLREQNVFNSKALWDYLLPVLVILCGVKMIVDGTKKRR